MTLNEAHEPPFCTEAHAKPVHTLSLAFYTTARSPSYILHEGRDGIVVRLLAFHQGEPGLTPGGVVPGFSHVGILLDAAGRRVFSEISRFSIPCIPVAPADTASTSDFLSDPVNPKRFPFSKNRLVTGLASQNIFHEVNKHDMFETTARSSASSLVPAVTVQTAEQRRLKRLRFRINKVTRSPNLNNSCTLYSGNTARELCVLGEAMPHNLDLSTSRIHEVLRADEGDWGEYRAAPECTGEGKGRSPSKPADRGIVRHDSHLLKYESPKMFLLFLITNQVIRNWNFRWRSIRNILVLLVPTYMEKFLRIHVRYRRHVPTQCCCVSPVTVFRRTRVVEFQSPRGATVTERLYCSPPTNVNRVQTSAGSLSDFRKWESYRVDATGRRAFSGISSFPYPFITIRLDSHLISASSALKTSMLRAAQISQLQSPRYKRCVQILRIVCREMNVQLGYFSQYISTACLAFLPHSTYINRASRFFLIRKVHAYAKPRTTHHLPKDYEDWCCIRLSGSEAGEGMVSVYDVHQLIYPELAGELKLRQKNYEYD
ncbi:hypothetical protein PR048_017268 [Dryococelus australis]|uniref:Uncharacterized protein n=1 Tax=Dryococelus australis TaxID=614101 RepID=A0ABQ9H914_9NEOP|nr:hypothetical protein PR048_017268 [Dryococelus australis]